MLKKVSLQRPYSRGAPSPRAGADDGGVWKVLRRVHASHGVGGLYAGLRPVMVRAFVANAAQWMAWEGSTRALRQA